MKLYTKKDGLVLEGKKQFINVFLECYSQDKRDGGVEILDEKEYQKYKKSKLKYKKLNIDYSKIKKIDFDFTYFSNFNGVSSRIVIIDHNNIATELEDAEIHDDNNFYITEIIQEDEGSNTLNFQEHVAPYFNLNLIKKYGIKLYDTVSNEYINLEKHIFGVEYNDSDT